MRLKIAYSSVRLKFMKLIILTGGIGSGKSTAGAILKEMGAEVIDSDQVARMLMEPGTPCFSDILKVFGNNILKVDGTLDRSKVANIVFNNTEALMKLNRIVHPRVEKAIEERLQNYEKMGVKAVFIEMAILLKAPFVIKANRVWVLKASKDAVIERLKGRGVSEKDAISRMANQPFVEEQIKDNLTIILNTGDKSDLKDKIQKLWEEL